MKLSASKNFAPLGLLSVLLASPAMAVDAASKASIAGGKAARGGEVATRRLVECNGENFMVEDFVVVEVGASNTTQEGFEGCYEIADTVDDDLELSLYKIDGNLTAAGGTFYASDNNGGYEEPIWFFANVLEGTATQNVSDTFLCFDLDLNAAAETHPAAVTNWGLATDGSTTTSRICEFATTCGCQVNDDDEEADDDKASDDAGAVDGDSSNAAFSITTSTTTTSGSIALIAGSAFMLAVVNGARA